MHDGSDDRLSGSARVDGQADRGRADDPFARAMRATHMPMVLSDPRLPGNPIVFANAAFERLVGYARHEIIGRNCRFLQGPDSDPVTIATIKDALSVGETVNVDILNYRKDGSSFWNALYISPVLGEDATVHYFFGSQLDVTDRVEAQRLLTEQKAMVEEEVRRRTADLEAALAAKTALLNEVDHRVKNNLTMMGALLRLQSRAIADPKVRTTLENMLTRVDALSTVHRRLYQVDDADRVDVGRFAVTLVGDVVGASGRSDIEVRDATEPVYIPAGQATAIGLILNELVTNAIKHAFANGRGGVLSISAVTCGACVRLEVHDDGEGFDMLLARPISIGHSLVERLSRQIGATTTWDGARQGTHVAIDLPLKPEA